MRSKQYEAMGRYRADLAGAWNEFIEFNAPDHDAAWAHARIHCASKLYLLVGHNSMIEILPGEKPWPSLEP